MADTDRCPRCDRAECRRKATTQIERDIFDEQERPRTAEWAQRYNAAGHAAADAEYECNAHRVDWRARALRAEAERDEAQRHARDHHVEGGCLTCAAMVAERDDAQEERRVAVAMLNAPEVAMRMCVEFGVLDAERKAAVETLTAERDTLRADLAAATAQATKQERLVEQQRAEIARLSDAVAAMRVRAAEELERAATSFDERASTFEESARLIPSTHRHAIDDSETRADELLTVGLILRRRAAALREEH